MDANGNPLDLSQRRDTYWIEENGEKIYGTAKNFLTDEEAAEYTLQNVLSGTDGWQAGIMTEACAKPSAKIVDGVMSWEAVPYAICYLITDGDKVLGFTSDTTLDTNPVANVSTGRAAAEYRIQAVNEFGGLSEKAPVIVSGVNDLSSVDAQEPEIFFDLQGRRLAAPVKGLNIIAVKGADGGYHIEKRIY